MNTNAITGHPIVVLFNFKPSIIHWSQSKSITLKPQISIQPWKTWMMMVMWASIGLGKVL